MDSRDAYLNCFEYAYAYETIAQSYILIHLYDLSLFKVQIAILILIMPKYSVNERSKFDNNQFSTSKLEQSFWLNF